MRGCICVFEVVSVFQSPGILTFTGNTQDRFVASLLAVTGKGVKQSALFTQPVHCEPRIFALQICLRELVFSSVKQSRS